MRKCLHILLIILFLCLAAQSCSVHSLHEAQTVVAEADSLRIQGQPYTDSVLMAQAYTTLGNWQYFYPDDYAHACYHYGRILRNKDNPAEAMQAFINATHSRTKDYHILGRVYSNMGTICHLAGEYDLSYNMYTRSSNSFINNGDTINYYYALNDMALELAVQGKKEETLSLLRHIEETCTEPQVLTKILETRAEIYKNTEPLDSAIYFINKLESLGYNEPLGILIKAQAFSRLGMSDSAILYANIILSDSCSPYQHRFNALYILSHNDTTLDQNEIRTIASEREDIRYYEYEPTQEKLSMAVQLLKQDLTLKPNMEDWLYAFFWTLLYMSEYLDWLYAIIFTLLILGGGIGLYRYLQRKKHNLLSQKIEKLSSEYADIVDSKMQHIEKQCCMYQASIDLRKGLCWKDFEEMCNIIDTNFYLLATKLKQLSVLSEQEIRLCVLVLLDFKRNQIADFLPYAENGVGKFKYRVAQKLGTEGKFLRKYLISLAIDEPLKSQ